MTINDEVHRQANALCLLISRNGSPDLMKGERMYSSLCMEGFAPAGRDAMRQLEPHAATTQDRYNNMSDASENTVWLQLFAQKRSTMNNNPNGVTMEQLSSTRPQAAISTRVLFITEMFTEMSIFLR